MHDQHTPDQTQAATSIDLAQEIQAEGHRLESLIAALDDTLDFCADDSRDVIRKSVGRSIDYIHFMRQITPRLLTMAEQIEILSRQEERRHGT